MPEDDDDDNFDLNEDFSEEDMAHFEKQRKEDEARVKKHPLLLQAKEILHIVDLLIDSAPDNEENESYTSTLKESAMIMLVKLSSGLRTDSYVLGMQNAAIIRDHAEYLRLSNHMLKGMEGFDLNYVKMFREEMEKFRLLFKNWAAELHSMEADYVDEDWGLFIK
jgi:hypothetical protein